MPYISKIEEEKQKILEILNSKELKEFINKYKSTPKKWVRLRKTIEKKESGDINEKTTLTIKHILKDNESNIQQMQETEIEVSSKDTISCTVDEIYKKIGLDINNMKELKF